MEKFGLVMALLTAASMALQQDFVNVEWESFKEKYGKAYISTQEEARRKHIFERNIELIIENNKKYAEGNITYKLAMNRFGDMLPFKDMSVRTTPSTKSWLLTRLDPYTLPSELASEEELPSGRTTNLESRSSPAVALDMTNFPEIDRNKQGGISPVTERKCLASYPYHAKSNCTLNRIIVAPNTTIFIRTVPPSEEEMKNSVQSIGPTCVAIWGTHDRFMFYSEGVYQDPGCTRNAAHHGVVLVGYGTTKQGKEYWVIKNSWGEQWGEGGFMRINAGLESECGSLRFIDEPQVQ